MKILKRNLFIKSFVLMLAVLALGSCKKSSDDGSDSVGAGKGTFKINGQTYSGICASSPAISGVAGNIDVVIAVESGASFTIYNMPTGSGGSSNVVNFNDTDVAYSPQLYAISILGQATLYHSVSGTVTKTGSNAYKFDISMLDVMNNTSVSATGSGKY
ncbi:hypothetical protein D0C36_14340 [Mucilaginibacter conchicola]|uniref:Lipoprotein n=1 Tax=Mucilaginibacter conchicola TaxID=2303333 RepID=A0A372NU15_9SPHI|nr:hypothetical protein [Mucilaginibacter conchicola]RFZ92592.1 hypothetical protein D0C36_14340 [Mucilaginibacter conchicola]